MTPLLPYPQAPNYAPGWLSPPSVAGAAAARFRVFSRGAVAGFGVFVTVPAFVPAAAIAAATAFLIPSCGMSFSAMTPRSTRNIQPCSWES